MEAIKRKQRRWSTNWGTNYEFECSYCRYWHMESDEIGIRCKCRDRIIRSLLQKALLGVFRQGNSIRVTNVNISPITQQYGISTADNVSVNTETPNENGHTHSPTGLSTAGDGKGQGVIWGQETLWIVLDRDHTYQVYYNNEYSAYNSACRSGRIRLSELGVGGHEDWIYPRPCVVIQIKRNGSRYRPDEGFWGEGSRTSTLTQYDPRLSAGGGGKLHDSTICDVEIVDIYGRMLKSAGQINERSANSCTQRGIYDLDKRLSKEV